MGYLKKMIKVKPEEIKREYIESNNNFIEEASDLFYREKRTARGWSSWIIGVFLIIVPLFISMFFKEDDLRSKVIFLMLFGFPGILTIIYGFVAPIKYLVFDRINGIIVMPRNFRTTVEIPFKTGHARQGYMNSSPGVISSMLGFVSSKDKDRVGGLLTEHCIEDFWSFTVWYMDKNRPLPPGSAFDAYREQDYQRRKAAGFPKPLYPSKIATPEATKEQQAARKRIGGW
ncbi:Probable transmembrane hypothetical protein [Tenacibaculum maritimum]|uniref:hypothetical protein n=1 Tax=Tenacibaculum maritimum TaxID=107401 RepID=UPI0012E4EBAF|nr:hypothetical protein [Tenacibaculum maritimum]CAA0216280.1 Probable transmembrane hypothetical protein [Tenacibaculum maritimum]